MMARPQVTLQLEAARTALRQQLAQQAPSRPPVLPTIQSPAPASSAPFKPHVHNQTVPRHNPTTARSGRPLEPPSP
jgi:hypothetical protein